MLKKGKLRPIGLSVLLVACTHTVQATNGLFSVYHDSVEITVPGYDGGINIIEGFPLKVTISEAKVKGFSYARCALDGSDIRFWFDTRTNNNQVAVSTFVNHKIAEWNPEGESTFYVQLPILHDNGNLKVTMNWSCREDAIMPAVDPSAVNEPPDEASLANARWKRNWDLQNEDDGYIRFFDAKRDGKTINYWKKWPSISKVVWRSGEKAAQVSQGIPLGGETELSYYDLTDLHVSLPGMPTRAGNYQMSVTVRENYEFTALEFTTNFTITAGTDIGGAAGADDFAYHAEMKVKGYTGESTLYNFPLLVRIRKGSPDSFDYNKFPYGCQTEEEVYADLAFFDGSGRILSYEIDTWDPEGESTLWVKVPQLKKNSSIRMCWGRAYGTKPLHNDPTSVWSEYFTVIHFNEEITAETAASTKSDDATGNGHAAEPKDYNEKGHQTISSTISVDGRFGRARQNQSNRNNTGADYQKTSRFELMDTAELALGNQFTVSGWFKSDYINNANARHNMALVSRKAAQGAAEGWLIEMHPNSDTALRERELYAEGVDGSGLTVKVSDDKDFPSAGWVYYSAAFNGENQNLGLVGGTATTPMRQASRAITAPGDTNRVISLGAYAPETGLLPFDGAFDEFRIKKGAVSRDWQRAEYDLGVAGTNYIDTGYTIHDVSKRFENRWTKYPTLSKIEWFLGEEPAEVFAGETLGDGISIHTRVSYQNRTTGEITTEMPTAEGEYRAIFTFPGDHTWSSLVATIDFRVVVERQHYEYGHASEARTLLGNDDYSISQAEAEFQSYDDTERGWGVPYWKHLNSEGEADDALGDDFTALSIHYNLFGGTHHELWFEDGKGLGGGDSKLWGLVNVRMGNAFNNRLYYPNERGTAGLDQDRNYLSWNPLSQRMLGYYGYPVMDYRAWAGTLVMRNVENAAVASKLYDDGIGTIYFDAVNFQTDNLTNEFGKANYKLVVEVATNYWMLSAEGYPYQVFSPPTDSAIEAEAMYDPYFYGDFNPVEMHVYRFHGETCEEFDTTELTLNIADGGSVTNFYRVRAKVNYEFPARFRIRRVAIDENYTMDPDAGSFILLDNVICSKPADRIILEPYGRYDPKKRGKEVLGQEAAFIPPFPGQGDNVIPRVRARRSDGRDPEPGRVTAATMHYRWHYLNQQLTAWQLVDFNVDDFASRDGEQLLLPGYDGDIEFWFEGTQNGGYYTYADYSGLQLGVPNYSEAISAMTNRMSETENWFVRVREGSSDIAEMELEVRKRAEYYDTARMITNYYPMALISDHTWRAFMPTTNEVIGGAVEYRFVRRNVQTSGAKSFAWNTNLLIAVEQVEEVPRIVQVEDGDDGWASLMVDQGTGYYMFRLNDLNNGLVISRSDYQNFNTWNDAHGEYFVGIGLPDGARPMSGSSGKTMSTLWPKNPLADTPATNSFWILTFDEYESPGGYPLNKTFDLDDMNTFDFGNAKYVCAAYGDERSGKALQLVGYGQGFVEKTVTGGGQDLPSGIEAVEFSARIAQEVEFADFLTWGPGWGYTNTEFYVRAAFDTKKCTGFTGKAALSAVSMYRDGQGCYEARLEQTVGNLDTKNGVVVHGASNTNKTFSIYKWHKVGGKMVADCVVAKPLSIRLPLTDNPTNNLFGLKLVANATKGSASIAAYICTNALSVADNIEQATWTPLGSYNDTDSPLKGGAFGVLSTSCEGLFVRPQAKLPFKNEEETLWRLEELEGEDNWAGGFWRMAYTNAWDTYAFLAMPVHQTVEVTLAKGFDLTTGDWKNKLVTTNVVQLSGFGSIDVSISDWSRSRAEFLRTQDCSVRLRAGGTFDDSERVDVVVDNISIRQWSGVNSPGFNNLNNSGLPNDFVYTSGWIIDGATRLAARRTKSEYPASVRTPLCDKTAGRGEGLGMVGFSYRNVHPSIHYPEEPLLYLQVITNNVSATTLANYSGYSSDMLPWETVAEFTAENLGSAGVTNIYLGIHGVRGVARLVLNQELVRDANLEENLDAGIAADDFGTIDIVEVAFTDEPSVDKGCWWGFNVRTIGDNTDSEDRMYLPDFHPASPGPGLSMALNNSATDQILPEDQSGYFDHMPFLQSPTFTNNVIGEITFRARMYETYDSAATAEVTLYGIASDRYKDINKDSAWERLETFVVSDPVFNYFSYKAASGKLYQAFRLAVTGVSGVNEPGPGRSDGYPPVRVLLDEVVVSERVEPRLGIRNVGAFRSNLAGAEYVPRVPSVYEQPMCEEGWGVQCELYTVTMAEEIDFTRMPRVRLHWFEGDAPWGFEKWKNHKNHKSAWMESASDSNLVYRSSYLTCPNAVIAASWDSPTIVQYTLEVEYYVYDTTTGKSNPMTMFLSIPDGDWRNPSWYYPLDLNREYGKGESFAAYCILENVAPNWAWINEANIFGVYDDDHLNTDRNSQFIEVAAPAEANLTGWCLQLVEDNNGETFVTNVIAAFDMDAPKSSAYMQSNMVFYVIARQDNNNDLRTDNGTFDNQWELSHDGNKCGLDIDGVISEGYPFALRLVRPSGIVAHEIYLVGTNLYAEWSISGYDPEYKSALYNKRSGAKTFSIGSDNGGYPNSLSVLEGYGETPARWFNNVKKTPGRINEGQYIDPDHPTPNGESVIIFCNLDQSVGPIQHKVGTLTNFTDEAQIVIIKKDSDRGTNILYKVGKWFELGSVTENGVNVYDGSGPVDGVWSVSVGYKATKNINLIATARVEKRLRDLGIDENNRYTPAVIDWLTKGTTANPNLMDPGFENPDAEELHLALFRDHNSQQIVTNLNLTTMYWLDIDPTAETNMIFEAGFVPQIGSQLIREVVVTNKYSAEALTNIQATIFMMITNDTTNVVSKYYQKCWSPYITRGLDPNYTSWDYYNAMCESGYSSWTSVTFKVRGILANGLTSEDNPDNWVPLRWFVFKPDSFYQPADEELENPHARYTADIEILDPINCKSSPGYYYWNDWVLENGFTPVLYSWAIDGILLPFQIEVLEPENFYREEYLERMQ